jgi:hypothetical protein
MSIFINPGRWSPMKPLASLPVELCQLCTDASGLIEFEPSSIAPINGSKRSGTCKLSACSRQPVQPHLLASCYWMPVTPGRKCKPSHSCNQTLRKSQLRIQAQNIKPTTSTHNFKVLQSRTSTWSFQLSRSLEKPHHVSIDLFRHTSIGSHRVGRPFGHLASCVLFFGLLCDGVCRLRQQLRADIRRLLPSL